MALNSAFFAAVRLSLFGPNAKLSVGGEGENPDKVETHHPNPRYSQSSQGLHQQLNGR